MKAMYYNMSCRITAGNLQTEFVKSIVVRGSIKVLEDTATITLPRGFNNLKIADKQNSIANKNITEIIKVGDPVRIELGYDGILYNEFKGYISKISADIPLVIECMDEMWQLKQSDYTKAFKTINVKTLLQYIAPGYQYEFLDENISLGKFTIENESAYQVLARLRKDYGLHSRFKENKVLVVGFPVSMKSTKKHLININRNVRAKKIGLEYVKTGDLRLLLKGISINDGGKRIVKTYGKNGGAVRTLHLGTNLIESEIDKLLEKNYKSLNFDGYKGKIPTWGLPLTKAGDAVNITDPNYKNSDRDGNYLIEAVTVRFDEINGWYRENTLSLKI
jgi:RNase H-fold protein (predicted Holliday junction resolvase)